MSEIRTSPENTKQSQILSLDNDNKDKEATKTRHATICPSKFQQTHKRYLLFNKFFGDHQLLLPQDAFFQTTETELTRKEKSQKKEREKKSN